MRKSIAALVVILCLPCLQGARGQSPAHFVLPNPNLLRCNGSDCSQVWPESVERKDIFPKQVIVDVDHGCIYGITAFYDKSIPFEQLKAAVDDRYQQWSVKQANAVLGLWRVEPQKFSNTIPSAGALRKSRPPPPASSPTTATTSWRPSTPVAQS
jgi:hypothetical protein